MTRGCIEDSGADSRFKRRARRNDMRGAAAFPLSRLRERVGVREGFSRVVATKKNPE
jgi:hypothetical protein